MAAHLAGSQSRSVATSSEASSRSWWYPAARVRSPAGPSQLAREGQPGVDFACSLRCHSVFRSIYPSHLPPLSQALGEARALGELEELAKRMKRKYARGAAGTRTAAPAARNFLVLLWSTLHTTAAKVRPPTHPLTHGGGKAPAFKPTPNATR